LRSTGHPACPLTTGSSCYLPAPSILVSRNRPKDWGHPRDVCYRSSLRFLMGRLRRQPAPLTDAGESTHTFRSWRPVCRLDAASSRRPRGSARLIGNVRHPGNLESPPRLVSVVIPQRISTARSCRQRIKPPTQITSSRVHVQLLEIELTFDRAEHIALNSARVAHQEHSLVLRVTTARRSCRCSMGSCSAGLLAGDGVARRVRPGRLRGATAT
jgi:hypothetical protein